MFNICPTHVTALPQKLSVWLFFSNLCLFNRCHRSESPFHSQVSVSKARAIIVLASDENADQVINLFHSAFIRPVR